STSTAAIPRWATARCTTLNATTCSVYPSSLSIFTGPPNYTSAFKAECVRQVVAGARQTDVARAQGIFPALLGHWQRQALTQAVPSSAERDEIKRLRAELKRVEMERDMLKKAVTIFSQPPQS
ncbi:MAG: hypothetical protein EOO60_13700, partial [Hymenobacter sp.]